MTVAAVAPPALVTVATPAADSPAGSHVLVVSSSLHDSFFCKGSYPVDIIWELPSSPRCW